MSGRGVLTRISNLRPFRWLVPSREARGADPGDLREISTETKPEQQIAGDGRWSLYVPISAPQLKVSEPLTLTVSGYTITLSAPVVGFNRVIVTDLTSADEAEKVFMALKRGLVATGLNLSVGIRVDDSLAVLRSEEDPLPKLPSQPFACHQGRSLARLFMTIGKPWLDPSKKLDVLQQSFDVGFLHEGVAEALADPRTDLACRLFSDSFFEATDEARLLSLIGVLEVLKDRDPVSPMALELIEKWTADLGLLSKEEADSFRGTLKYMTAVSIGRGIRSVVERHLGAERAREAQKLYTIRSTLVHDGVRPDDLQSVVRKSETLSRELLASILTSAKKPDDTVVDEQ